MKKIFSFIMSIMVIVMLFSSLPVSSESDIGLSAELADEIKEAYVALMKKESSKYYEDTSSLTVDDVEIELYFGNLDGYEVVLLYFTGYEHTGPRIPGTMGPYSFTAPYESIFDNIYAYKDGELTFIKIAERDISSESIYKILYPTYYYGYWTQSFIEDGIYDVQLYMYYVDEVEFVYRHGIMKGTSDRSFSPDELYTRATLITTLWRIAGEPAAEGTAPFTDLTQDWYIPAVNWAYEEGIVKGTGDAEFSPDAWSSRAELVTMMHRFAVYRGYDNGERADVSEFNDADKIPEYAADAFEWAVANEIIVGEVSTGYPVIVWPCSDSEASTVVEAGGPVTIRRIKPLRSASRAELAVVLTRFCVKLEGMAY